MRSIPAGSATVLMAVISMTKTLDHEADKDRLSGFLDKLRAVMVLEDGADSRLWLVMLLTTSGLPQVLASALEINEMCDMNRRSAAHGPYRTQEGR